MCPDLTQGAPTRNYHSWGTVNTGGKAGTRGGVGGGDTAASGCFFFLICLYFVFYFVCFVFYFVVRETMTFRIATIHASAPLQIANLFCLGRHLAVWFRVETAPK